MDGKSFEVQLHGGPSLSSLVHLSIWSAIEQHAGSPRLPRGTWLVPGVGPQSNRAHVEPLKREVMFVLSPCTSVRRAFHKGMHFALNRPAVTKPAGACCVLTAVRLVMTLINL